MWKFKKIEPGMLEIDPHNTEFFRLNDPPEAIVREFIQNALDAKVLTSEIVEVKIKIGNVNILIFINPINLKPNVNIYLFILWILAIVLGIRYWNLYSHYYTKYLIRTFVESNIQ